MCDGCEHKAACKALLGELPKVVGTCYTPMDGRGSKFDFLKSPQVIAPRVSRALNGHFTEIPELV